MIKIKHLHLFVSILLLAPAAFGYGGVAPALWNNLFDFTIDTTDQHNMFSATMGLYLSICVIGFLGILKSDLWRLSTFSNSLCMGGLALGRAISMVIFGLPSYALIIGFAIEGLLAIWGIFNLIHYRNNKV